MYNLSLLKKHNIFFPEGKNYEGNLFLLKAVYYANCIYFAPDTFYNYYIRMDGNSISQPKDKVAIKKNLEDRCYIFTQMCKFMKEHSFSNNEIIQTCKYIAFSVFDKDDIYEYKMDLILQYMGRFMLKEKGIKWCFKKLRHTLRNKRKMKGYNV